MSGTAISPQTVKDPQLYNILFAFKSVGSLVKVGIRVRGAMVDRRDQRAIASAMLRAGFFSFSCEAGFLVGREREDTPLSDWTLGVCRSIMYSPLARLRPTNSTNALTLCTYFHANATGG